MNKKGFYIDIIEYGNTIFSGDIISLVFIGTDGGEIEIIENYCDSVFIINSGQITLTTTDAIKKELHIKDGIFSMKNNVGTIILYN